MSISPGPAHSTRLHPFNTILSSFKVLFFQKAINSQAQSILGPALSSKSPPLLLYQALFPDPFIPLSFAQTPSLHRRPSHPVSRDNHPPFHSAKPIPRYSPGPNHNPTLNDSLNSTSYPARLAPSTWPDPAPNISTNPAPQGMAPFLPPDPTPYPNLTSVTSSSPFASFEPQPTSPRPLCRRQPIPSAPLPGHNPFLKIGPRLAPPNSQRPVGLREPGDLAAGPRPSGGSHLLASSKTAVLRVGARSGLCCACAERAPAVRRGAHTRIRPFPSPTTAAVARDFLAAVPLSLSSHLRSPLDPRQLCRAMTEKSKRTSEGFRKGVFSPPRSFPRRAP